MTEDRLLFAAALANPAEDTPRLVLADWFDEHDEPDLAAALRVGREMVAFLSELTRWDASPVCRSQVYESGAMRDVFPALPAAQLLTRYIAMFPVPPAAVTEFDENAPPPRSHSDPLNPAAFLSRWQHERQRQIAALRELAAREADKLAAQRAFNAQPDAQKFEEQSCRLHESVLRECVPSAIPGALGHAARMNERGHPLAWLPLALLGPDGELPRRVPRFGTAGTLSYGTLRAGDPLPIRALGPDVPAVIGSEALAPESPTFAAVRGWAEESNGALEGHVFRLDRPLDAAAVGRLWFSRLPADSLNAALVNANWSVNRLPTSGALGALFGAAHGGGAYGRREWGAYGRLHAWQSLGALAGCAPTLRVEVVAAEALRCEWFDFDGTNWFNHIAWDLGLICVRPDRRTVALLAATDTD
jgi:uncharacterized protein (TIGR02996 family)